MRLSHCIVEVRLDGSTEHLHALLVSLGGPTAWTAATMPILRLDERAHMNDRPLFVALAGPDGSGKTTTLNMLRKVSRDHDEPILFLEKKAILGNTGYASAHLATLRDLIWDHPKDAPVHLLGEMHWMHLQAAWFHAVSHYVIRPALAAGTTVITDGWHHKFLARVSLAPSLDHQEIAGFFDGVAEPDCVILLDADPALTASRKRSFTEIEGGNFRGDSKATQQTFQSHQGALRQKLLEAAARQGWSVLPVAEKSKEDVYAEVLAILAEWKLVLQP